MHSRKSVKCRDCGSLERTRLFWLYLEKLKLCGNERVLHIAPEKSLAQRLSEILEPGNYVPADIDPTRYKHVPDCRKIDLTDMEGWPSNEFDLILHIHVMEHIPCNIAYPFFHLHRMLKETGTHLCVVPFLSGRYDECFGDIGDEERIRRFGQFDHVRRFGREDLNMHLGKVVDLPDHFDATRDFSEELLTEYNIPRSNWKGFHPGTVLRLSKR